MRLARSQAIVARNLLRGWPIVYTGTTSMTIDEDDLALADTLLANRGDWASRNPCRRVRTRVCGVERQPVRVCVREWPGRTWCRGRGAGPHRRRLVVMPGYSCVVVASALRHAGLQPIFADIELDTYGLDKSALRQAISPRTKAILLHHLFGFVCRDLEAVLEIARERGLRVIEDCAQATGAMYQGRKVGNFGDIAIFSGDPSKPFTCIQGGVAVTNDEDLADGWARSEERLEPIRPRQSNSGFSTSGSTTQSTRIPSAGGRPM